MQHARETEEKKKRDGFWYSSRLLSYFQLNCSGLPRYNYIPHKQNNLVCAQIILPDMRVFCGDFRPNVTEATESAAKKVFEVILVFANHIFHNDFTVESALMQK